MILYRKFTRAAINDMGERPFVEMHERSIQRVEWDQWQDTLDFVFDAPTWCWLVLKYPELNELYLKEHNDSIT